MAATGGPVAAPADPTCGTRVGAQLPSQNMFELGNNLREARQYRRIDLVIAEQDTKIRSKYLAALESEDFDVLPGPVFVRGFLRTYSRYLGLDPQLFIEEYNARFGRFEDLDEHHHSPVLGRPGLAQAREQRGRRTLRTIIVLTLVAVAGMAWLGLHQPPHQAPAADDDATPRTAPANVTSTGGTPLDVAANAAARPTVPATTPPTPYAIAAKAFRTQRTRVHVAQARAAQQASTRQ
ncbi:MAG: hypothetical protein JWN41_249 [Thermoleophilia bacterium]|nr:hypothetical protein [Thermoleophilia bacterium]